MNPHPGLPHVSLPGVFKSPFLLCKMKLIKIPILRGCCEDLQNKQSLGNSFSITVVKNKITI